MKEAISRQAAIEAVNCVIVMRGIRSGKDATTKAIDCVKRIIADNIRQLPSVQPEIVRCKDCKFWAKQENSMQGRCALLQIYPTGEWFCGNASREVTK